MTILFGWNRFRLKTFTFQELNLPELEEFPNATFQVAQSYFHLFYIPVFPMGKRYDLVMDKKLYHVPPSLMKMINPEQIKVRGKWYAWTFLILFLVILSAAKITRYVESSQVEKEAIEFAQIQREFFDNPEIGDLIEFDNNKGFSFYAEVFNIKDSKVVLVIDLMHIQDNEVLERARNGKTRLSEDSLNTLMDERDQLEENSVYRDSLVAEYPDQPLFTKLVIFELEGYPIKYEMIYMPIKEYKSLKHSIGDNYTTAPKALKIPSFSGFSKDKFFVKLL